LADFWVGAISFVPRDQMERNLGGFSTKTRQKTRRKKPDSSIIST